MCDKYNKTFAILIPSCDKYSDMWNPLIENLFKMCPDFNLKIYLVSNFKKFDHKKVTVINVGEDISWSSNVKIALAHIEEKYIFMLIDDLFFNKPFKIELLKKYFTIIQEMDMDYFRFNPTPKATIKTPIYQVNKCECDDYYRTSTVMSVWRKSVLLETLNAKENAWEFEYYGSNRSQKYSKWYASNSWILPFDNLVIKGLIEPQAYKSVNSRGIELSSDRPVMSLRENCLNRLNSWRSNIFKMLPRSMRLRVKSYILNNKNKHF